MFQSPPTRVDCKTSEVLPLAPLPATWATPPSWAPQRPAARPSSTRCRGATRPSSRPVTAAAWAAKKLVIYGINIDCGIYIYICVCLYVCSIFYIYIYYYISIYIYVYVMYDISIYIYYVLYDITVYVYIYIHISKIEHLTSHILESWSFSRNIGFVFFTKNMCLLRRIRFESGQCYICLQNQLSTEYVDFKLF